MKHAHRTAALLRLRDLQRRAADRALASAQGRLARCQEEAAAAESRHDQELRAAHAYRLPCDAWAVRQRAQLNAAARLCQEAGEVVDRARAETVARRQDHESAQRIFRAARAALLADEARREDSRLLELAVNRRTARISPDVGWPDGR